MSERAHTKGREHTPGPWSVKRSAERHDGEYDYAISAVDALVLAEAFGRDAVGRYPAAEANARLIAAAPDMFEAGTVVLDYMGLDEFLDNDRIDRNVVWGIRKAELLALRAALAKASPAPTKGEASDVG